MRFSCDEIPVVVHDQTLKRTHRLEIVVSNTQAKTLKQHGIPSLEDVLSLAKAYNKRIILDIKVLDATIFKCIINTCRKIKLSTDAITCLIWKYKHPDPLGLTVYKACETVCRIPANAVVDGIALKYDGSVRNITSINNVLDRGFKVNLFIPDERLGHAMIKEYIKNRRVTFTV